MVAVRGRLKHDLHKVICVCFIGVRVEGGVPPTVSQRAFEGIQICPIRAGRE